MAVGRIKQAGNAPRKSGDRDGFLTGRIWYMANIIQRQSVLSPDLVYEQRESENQINIVLFEMPRRSLQLSGRPKIEAARISLFFEMYLTMRWITAAKSYLGNAPDVFLYKTCNVVVVGIMPVSYFIQNALVKTVYTRNYFFVCYQRCKRFLS